MEQALVIIVLIAVVIGFGVVIAILNARLRELKSSTAVELMKTDVTELSRAVAQLQQSVGERLDQSKRPAFVVGAGVDRDGAWDAVVALAERHQALGGGVTRSLALDAHGKSLSSALLDLEIELPPDHDRGVA